MTTPHGRGLAAITILVTAGLATGQVQQVAVTVDNSDTEGTRATDASLGVNDHAVLITTNQYIGLYTKATGSQEDLRAQGAVAPDPLFPIVGTATSNGLLFDPRSNYDAINDRLWYFYSERDDRTSSTIAKFHVGISKAGATLDTLGSADWHLYTGGSGVAGAPFDMRSTSLKAYQGFPDHKNFPAYADFPSMGLDERAMIFAPYSADLSTSPAQFQAIFVIPTSHGSGLSILDGDRPNESDITIIRLDTLPLAEDRSIQNYVIQEPFDQAQNATFLIGLDGDGGPETAIRLKGLFYDDLNDRWQVQQQRDPIGGGLVDMDLPGASLDFFDLSSQNQGRQMPRLGPMRSPGSSTPACCSR